jgi:drug/metabolite transporter (DMT)-like permease
MTQSMQYRTALRGALILCISPLLTLTVVGAIVLSEPITLQRVSGTGLIVAGIYMVYQSGPPRQFRSAPSARKISTRCCPRR